MINITKKPINISQIMKDCKDQSAGAMVLFTGSVRDHNEKEKVSGIYYEAYIEMAKNILVEIENEVLRKWHVRKFIAIHRIGSLKVNDISVAIAVTTEHRQDAFEACKYTIDNIKTRIPIWKKELSESGNATWNDGIVPFSIERNQFN
ncbi:MAG TPA: molybdenum cofactor biosynthesis protein MoaE [Nitrososphaeraceae archaeon]|jgi:molybdopterin synthase catalytic subunit|nr:molybdenum cofactor biosynthesis protein MoaE [Nitrososphaeraceae archaeon]